MQFIVNNRHIKYINDNLIGDNADYIATFKFDAEWDGKIKTARFIRGNQYFDKILINDSCTIPVEILKQGFIKIGVFTDEMTSTYCEKFIKESIKETNGSPIAPTEDVYTQIIKMIEESIPESGVITNFKTNETLTFNENGELSVNTTNDIEEDNTLPITASAVYTIIGNINILLSII